MDNNYEVFENEEQETGIVACGDSESKKRVGFGGVLAIAAAAGCAIWGAKKLYNKFHNKRKSNSEDEAEMAATLREKGYTVTGPCEYEEIED
jgi:hypothetical protein